jgi:hypothetical protein
MPEFEIKKEDLRMFPEAITADAIQEIKASLQPRRFTRPVIFFLDKHQLNFYNYFIANI